MRHVIGQLAVLIAVCMSPGPAIAGDSQPVTLGAIYGLTGPWDELGVPSERGTRLFVKQVNGKGGVLGRPVTLIVKDTGGIVAKAAEDARDILAADPHTPAILGLTDTDFVLAAARVAADARRVFVTSGATSPKLPAEIPTYLFLACFGDNVQAAAAAQFVVDTLKKRSASIVYDRNHTYTRLLQGYFRDSFEARGGELRSVVEFDGPGKLAAVTDHIADADILFMAAGSPADTLRVVEDLRASGFHQPIVGGDGYDGVGLWEQDAGLAHIYYTTHGYFGADHPSAVVKQFRKDYMAEYGEEPGSFAGLGFDAAGLIVAAMEKAGSAAPDKVLEALAAIRDFQGVTGTISFENGSRIPTKSVTIMRVDHGKRVFVEQTIPEHVPAP